MTTVEYKEFLPGSPLSHLYYRSRNKDLSLVSGMCIRGRGVNQLLTLVHDWDDTGPPPTCTSRN